MVYASTLPILSLSGPPPPVSYKSDMWNAGQQPVAEALEGLPLSLSAMGPLSSSFIGLTKPMPSLVNPAIRTL